MATDRFRVNDRYTNYSFISLSILEIEESNWYQSEAETLDFQFMYSNVIYLICILMNINENMKIGENWL